MTQSAATRARDRPSVGTSAEARTEKEVAPRRQDIAKPLFLVAVPRCSRPGRRLDNLFKITIALTFRTLELTVVKLSIVVVGEGRGVR
ncbi:MAG: hypothetical protein Kilf2KO_00370 [Rhodospirillales bacterium]